MSLRPAFNILSVRIMPAGATVYVDGRPFTDGDAVGRGKHRILAQKSQYHGASDVFDAPGDGTEIVRTLELKPDFGTAHISCTDPSAEIFVDGSRVGTGSWRGTLASGPHVVEARRSGHESQSINIDVLEGAESSFEVPAPIGRYGILSIESEPAFCEVRVDGNLLGETPGQFKLLEGEHAIKVSREGSGARSASPKPSSRIPPPGEARRNFLSCRERRTGHWAKPS